MEYISSAFATFLNMCAAEHMARNKGVILRDNDALKLFFEKQVFKVREIEEEPLLNYKNDTNEINKWREIPFLHNLLMYCFKNKMCRHDQLDATVKVISTNSSGLKLGIIQSLTIGQELPIYENYEIDWGDMGYDLDDCNDLPRLVLIDESKLSENNLHYSSYHSADELEFNFYKRRSSDKTVSYHYWEEEVKSKPSKQPSSNPFLTSYSRNH